MVGVRALLIAASLLLVGAGSALADSHDRFSLEVPVLMFHRISAAPRGALLPDLWVRPADLRAQLVALHRRGWRTVTAAEVAQHLRDREPLPPRSFVITIDDGARDGFTHAAPVLRSLGMRATFYVTPGRVGRRWQLTWPMLRALQAEGHEIANHSLSHGDLPSLSDAALRREIVEAQDLLERNLGTRPTTFCYPFGHQDRRVRRAVAAAGLQLAFTTAWGASIVRASPLLAPRVRVSAGQAPRALVARLEPIAGRDVRAIAAGWQAMTWPPVPAPRRS